MVFSKACRVWIFRCSYFSDRARFFQNGAGFLFFHAAFFQTVHGFGKGCRVWYFPCSIFSEAARFGKRLHRFPKRLHGSGFSMQQFFGPCMVFPKVCRGKNSSARCCGNPARSFVLPTTCAEVSTTLWRRGARSASPERNSAPPVCFPSTRGG